MFELVDGHFDPAEALRVFQDDIGDAGAIATFSGQVRRDSDGGPVMGLTLEAFPGVTERGIEHAMTETKARWPITAVKVVHRIGRMGPGDPIVFVAAASKHRRAAFEAVDYLMDYLKTQAVFWKQEHRANGSIWIEPRTQDYEDQARWAAKGT